MKLYYSPGACSLCPDIVLREAGVTFDLVRVNLQEKKLLDGTDYLAISPKGQVPALALEDGGTLTECAAIIQYLADHYPQADLAPAPGSAARYRLLEWLSFIGSELHKTFPALFIPRYPPEFKPFARQTLERKFAVLEQHLAGNRYLMGEKFTIADAYCFAIVIWHKRSNIDIAPWPNLKSYMERIAARPTVREAMEAEAA